VPAVADEGALRVLVTRARQHDPDAWEALYRHAYRRLYGYSRRRLWSDEAAEDAVSETMARALDGIDRFTWRGAGFDAWLYGIARNVVREAARTGSRAIGTATLPEQPAAERAPEDRAVGVAEEQAVRRAFQRLEDDERELLELRVHGGLTSEEVGHILGKQAGAVRMAQARIVRRLRVLMEELDRVD